MHQGANLGEAPILSHTGWPYLPSCHTLLKHRYCVTKSVTEWEKGFGLKEDENFRIFRSDFDNKFSINNQTRMWHKQAQQGICHVVFSMLHRKAGNCRFQFWYNTTVKIEKTLKEVTLTSYCELVNDLRETYATNDAIFKKDE